MRADDHAKELINSFENVYTKKGSAKIVCTEVIKELKRLSNMYKEYPEITGKCAEMLDETTIPYWVGLIDQLKAL